MAAKQPPPLPCLPPSHQLLATTLFATLPTRPSPHTHTHSYQDYQAADIPTVTTDAGRVRVMAGSFGGTTGPIVMRNPGLLWDVVLQPGGSLTLPVPQGYAAFAYVYDGAAGTHWRLTGWMPASCRQACMCRDGALPAAVCQRRQCVSQGAAAGRSA